MKKLRVFSILILLASAAAFVAFRFYETGIADNTAPVISCDTESISASVADGEEALLQGVTASDDRDGDVTGRVVVQEISEMQEDGTRLIRYAVSDSSGNVGYAERSLEYTDYSEPVFSLGSPLLFPLGSSFNVCEGLSASSSLDGDLTDKIKYTLDQTISTVVEGTYRVEYRVSDGAGNTSYLETELEVYDSGDYPIDVYLSEYLIYIQQGQIVDLDDYYAGTDSSGDVSMYVDSNLDSSQPGCYYADYFVTNGAYRGWSRLIIVVTE